MLWRKHWNKWYFLLIKSVFLYGNYADSCDVRTRKWGQISHFVSCIKISIYRLMCCVKSNPVLVKPNRAFLSIFALQSCYIGIVKMMTVLLIFNPEVIVLCTFKYLKTSNTLLPREFQWSDKIGTTLMQFSTSLNPTVTSLINIK